uniref:C-type lectin domain-containing protein n=1 Tax=Anabas testudineus TaxID=64144 RepID=A0A3Q1IZQ1_ANATE
LRLYTRLKTKLTHSNICLLLSGTGESRMVEKSSYRAAAVILGLLCLLLLTGLMSLVFLCKCFVYILTKHSGYTVDTKGSSETEMEMVQLQTSYTNLTEEKDQLQTSYNNLTEERDQLQTSYNNLAKERDHGSLYYMSSSEKSWEEGRNDCRQKGTDLVIINSSEEQDFIRGWKKQTWIGLTDKQTEGTWRWVDGTVLTTPRFWAESEPNNEGDEHCAEIRNYDSQNSWNDVSCNVGKYWICEKSFKD